MSESIAKATLTALPNGVTYACMFTSSVGDVTQRYNESKVVPDWEADPSKCPVLNFHCISSAVTSGETIPANIKLFLDDKQVTFAAGSKVSTDGMFELMGGQTGSTPTIWQIKIRKNYVKPGTTTQASHVLKVEGELTDGSKVQGQTALNAALLTDTGTSVTITGEGTNPFVVDQNIGNSTTLKATIFEGGEPLATPVGFTYQWYQMGTSGWVAISGKTASTLVVTADMVESYAEFRVVVKKGSDTFSDTQSVMDIGDPYFATVDVQDGSGTSSDGNFGQAPSATDVRKLTAKLFNRKSGADVSSKILHCYWQIVNSEGVIVNSSYSGGKDGNGVWDSKQDQQVLTIPYKYLSDNHVLTLDVYATISY